MTTAVCTLFEGDFHYGVGAIANSLHARGYRGKIYAGYRGKLPRWVNVAHSEGLHEYSPAEGLTLRFVPISADVHLGNYKPHFMLNLWEECPEVDALYYFDPDILVKCRWSFFEEWIEAGIALCMDVNPCMPSNHPTRFRWKQFCQKHGLPVVRDLDTYFNSGFLGLSPQHFGFVPLSR